MDEELSQNSYTPLDGTDRIKIISFFALLILPVFWFGFSVPIFLMLIISLYIMKKDKDFSLILKTSKYIENYLSILIVIAGALVLFGLHKLESLQPPNLPEA